MSTNTIIQQGRFTSTGTNVLISLRGGVSWMNVYNTTQMNAGTNGHGFQYYWQLGMSGTDGIVYANLGSPQTGTAPSYQSGCFQVIDTSAATLGVVNNTITAISTAAAPVVTNTGTNGLVAGNVVRLTNVAGGATGFNGIDWLVGSTSLSATTFQLYTAPQLSVAGTTGSFEVINFDPIFYPRHRIIAAAVSSGGVTTIQTNVPHGYQVGQQIRLNVVDPVYGSWVAANNLVTTVTNVHAGPAFSGSVEFDISDDLTALGTLAFPNAATTPFTPAQITPVGENTAYAQAQGVNILSDATINTAEVGLLLYAGTQGPAGSNS